MTNITQLGLLGDFVDGFIYRTQLYVVTSDGEFRSYQVSDIEDQLAAEMGPAGNAMAYLLFHSKGLGASPRQVAGRRRFRGTGQQFQDVSIWLDGEDVGYESFDLGLKGQSVLDLLMYYDHMYVASTEGLWSTRLDRIPTREDKVGLRRRLDSPCSSAEASMGAVAISCGEEGLTVLLDEFSWLGERRRVRASGVSVRAAYATTGLFNYHSRRDFHLLSGSVEEHPKRHTFVGFTRTSFGHADLLRKILPGDGISEDDLDFAVNVRSTFIALIAGDILTVPLKTNRESGQRYFQSPRRRGSYQGRVVGAELLEDDLLLETQLGVVVVPKDQEAQTVYEGPVTSLRVFPRSKRYLQLALVVGDRGLVMMPSPSTVAALTDQDSTDWEH